MASILTRFGKMNLQGSGGITELKPLTFTDIKGTIIETYNGTKKTTVSYVSLDNLEKWIIVNNKEEVTEELRTIKIGDKNYSLPEDNFRIVPTTAERDTISNKKKGLLVYVESDSTLYQWVNNQWSFIPHDTDFSSLFIQDKDGKITLDVTDQMEENNYKPITSNRVFRTVGYINTELLKI